MIKNTSSIYYPPGSVTTCATTYAPNGWVICDGGTFDGTDIKYTNLWTVLGTTYGGSNQSSFRVPNIGGRTVAGRKSSFAGTGLDGPVGSWTGSTSTTLTSGQTGVKSHSHTVKDDGHSHSISTTMGTHTHNAQYGVVNWETKSANLLFYNADGGNPQVYPSTYTNVTVSLTRVENLTSLSVNNNTSANASTSHTNTQPSLSLNYIIKL
jgi:microcystin-dependent protein